MGETRFWLTAKYNCSRKTIW